MRLGRGALQLVLFLFVESFFPAEGDKPPLYILVLAPFPADSEFNLRYTGSGGPGIMPLVDRSLQQINDRDGILDEYELKVIPANSGCAIESIATESLLRHVYTRDEYTSLTPIVGVIGSVCSTASIAVASLLARREGSLLQYTIATSPELSAYGNTVRALGTSRDFVDSFLKLMEVNNWARVGTLYESDRVFFSETHNIFQEEIRTRTNYSISPSSVSKTHIDLSPFKATLTRVIVVFAASDLTRKIICMAHQKHLDLTYPSYQLFFTDKNIDHLKNATKFVLEDTLYNCSREEMIESLHGTVIISIRSSRREDNATKSITLESGLTYGEHLDWMYGLNISIDGNANAYYDGVWSFALALNELVSEFNLSNYRYGQQTATNKIRQKLVGLEFEGASGRVSFGNTLDGKPLLDFNFSQLNEETHDVEEVVVAVYNSSVSAFSLAPNDTFFIEDDSFTVSKVHISIGIVMSVLILAVFILTATLHILNLIYSERKTVKATSPTLNNLMFSGCYLFTIAALAVCIEGPFYSDNLPSTIYSVSCNVISWCVPMGYSLIFGTICVKTFRIYRLFTGIKRHGVLLSDQFLTLYVVSILFLDVIISVIWSSVDPWIVDDTTLTISGGKLFVEPYCKCRNFFVWVAVIGLSKFLLTLLVIFLSILTRHVDREEFKYTKNINILAYALALPYCVGIPIAALLASSSPYIRFFILCPTFLSSVILCQITLFIPPLVPILFKKKRCHSIAVLVHELAKN